MASTYSTNLKIELMSTGENSGIWGNTTNTNLGTALEQAIVGYGNPDFIADANLTISITNSNAAQAARALVLNVTSVFGSLTATRELVVPTSQKQYIVQNNTAGAQSITVKTSGGTGITVPNGRRAHLYVEGTNVVQMFDFVDINGGAIDGTPIGGASAAAGAFTTLNTSSTTTLSGLTASTALALNASKNVVSVANTGTGSNVLNTSPTLVTPALGTPSSGVVTNLTGTASININGTVGATTPAAGAFTTLSASGATILSGGTANGVAFLNGSKVLTSGSVLTFDGSFLNLNRGSAGTLLNLTDGVTQTLLIATTASAADIDNPSGGALSFSIATSEQMRLTSTGLGIGTSSPGKKLDVNGDAAINGLTVGKGAGAISSNTALGSSALNSNTTGSSNTANGANALLANTTGSSNTASGLNALQRNTTGLNNTASGVNALLSNTTGNDNTASGVNALQGNTTGNSNTASGLNALLFNTTGNSNTASGVSALRSNTTGFNNTASGVDALRNNTTGTQNTASGQGALQLNTTGSFNTASGQGALFSNTTGINNTASGQGALFSNTTGTSNTASGRDALVLNTTGTQNTASGQGALRNNTTGIQNTASGQDALFSNTTGSGNTASGYQALLSNTTGSGNTAINPLNSAGSYVPVFDPTTENNRFCMGSTGVTNAYIQVAWTVVSDARDKINFAPVPHGLEFVKALQPTAYQFRTARDSEETNGGVRYGFKAQDVLTLEGANPVIVDNEDADKLRMIDTALIPVLVKAIQEQQALIESLTTRLTALESNP
jgi:hypothetical protein